MDGSIKVLILGSIALDTIQTPFGKKENLLGGSATYAAVVVSFFTKPGIVSIIGTDFPSRYYNFLKKRSIGLEGVVKKGKTFRWSGLYEYDMNVAKTLRTELNCLEVFDPILPDKYKGVPYVLLGNMHPLQQERVLEQVIDPKFVVMDTMNLWIEHTREDLIKLIKKVDLLLLNDGEARQLFGEVNLVRVAKKALRLGPRFVVIKKGEHGALLFTKDYVFSVPGYPLEEVVDPTGCGDTFAGGLLGYISSKGVSTESIKKGIVFGSICASFNAEGFGLSKLKRIKREDISRRYKEFQKLVKF